jgi:hypothetical protein
MDGVAPRSRKEMGEEALHRSENLNGLLRLRISVHNGKYHAYMVSLFQFCSRSPSPNPVQQSRRVTY